MRLKCTTFEETIFQSEFLFIQLYVVGLCLKLSINDVHMKNSIILTIHQFIPYPLSMTPPHYLLWKFLFIDLCDKSFL